MENIYKNFKKKDHLIQPENCKNFWELQESPDTTGELRESKKIVRFWKSCRNSCDSGLVGIQYIIYKSILLIYSNRMTFNGSRLQSLAL